MQAPEVIPADAKVADAYLMVKMVAEAIGIILTLKMIDSFRSNGPSQQALFWDRVRRICQRSALELGKVGLMAEARYQELMKP